MRPHVTERRSRRWLAAAALAAAPLVLARPSPAAEIIDRVVASVSGDLVMLSDIALARELGLAPPDRPDREVLAQLIDRALVLVEVNRYGPPEPEPDAVFQELVLVRSRFPAREGLENALKRVGLDEERLQERLRQDLRIRAYLDQRFTVLPPAADEVRRFYEAHPERFTRDGRVRPFEEVQVEAARAALDERRRTLVDEWVAGLRRRATIVDLLEPPR
jgi:hypothetical protein